MNIFVNMSNLQKKAQAALTSIVSAVEISKNIQGFKGHENHCASSQVYLQKKIIAD